MAARTAQELPRGKGSPGWTRSNLRLFLRTASRSGPSTSSCMRNRNVNGTRQTDDIALAGDDSRVA
ncbi:hypothetical protein FOMPIDRAFT_1025634 [Fomitopsis schrenkii]|uniref:Uncharacterized protein n=1 Tax=Fomitopsis schrenkii TaxID=2126942 RepID=S8F213_FOMSC|nr:hypothetical protein FOMPIDRAFT_1025634 [Fomitopsis schrenkii]